MNEFTWKMRSTGDPFGAPIPALPAIPSRGNVLTIDNEHWEVRGVRVDMDTATIEVHADRTYL